MVKVLKQTGCRLHGYSLASVLKFLIFLISIQYSWLFLNTFFALFQVFCFLLLFLYNVAVEEKWRAT